jgi:hypothetical protein
LPLTTRRVFFHRPVFYDDRERERERERGRERGERERERERRKLGVVRDITVLEGVVIET